MFYEQNAEYKSYLPDIFQDVLELDALNTTITIELDKLNSIVKSGTDDKSVQYASEQGIARWEKILGVNSPLNSSLQARREALKSKLMTKPPINLLTLKGIIEAYMGVAVDISIAGFTVKVRYRGVSRIADLSPLYETAYATIPANLLLDIAYAYVIYSEEATRFSTYAAQGAYTYNQIMKGEF